MRRCAGGRRSLPRSGQPRNICVAGPALMDELPRLDYLYVTLLRDR
jgi:hypothetical protein